MIRECEEKDLDEVLILVEKFFNENIGRFLKYDRDKAMEDIKNLFKSGTLKTFVIDDGKIRGMISALVTRSMFTDEAVATELVWYVDSEHRKAGVRLYKSFEKYLKSIGVNKIIMIHMEGGESVGDFYKMCGYRELEKSYIKEI